MANLNDLTNEQREEYYQRVCKTIGLDPALRLLDYIWIDQGNGLKNLVLYCRRGGAEILRANQGIEVVDLIQHDGPGYVSFKAIGKNKVGRQEVANGTHSIEGLKGERLAYAIMTASTRSLRRMTMQFTGCGVLDESEVNAPPEANISPAASQAALAGSPTVIPPPQVAPSTIPGKDITALPSPEELAPRLKAMTEATKGLDLTKDGYRKLPAPAADMDAHVAKVYADGAKALADMQPTKMVTTLVPEPAQPERIQTSPFPPEATNQVDIKADTEPVKRRGRRPGSRNKNSVDISSPGQQIEIPPGQIDAAGKITPVPEVGATVPNQSTPVSVPLATAKEPEREAIGNGRDSVPALAETPQPNSVVTPPIQPVEVVAPQVVVPVLSKEKQEEYRTRLSKYYNNILPAGGMQSSENIGGPTMKTRKFAAIYTGVSDTKLMTEQHWEDLFGFMDANAANPKFLVEYINKSLGVTV